MLAKEDFLDKTCSSLFEAARLMTRTIKSTAINMSKLLKGDKSSRNSLLEKLGRYPLCSQWDHWDH